MEHKRQMQAKLARMEIVSKLYLRQYTVRQIREEVMKRLDLKTYSTFTVQQDIKTILKELQEQRLDNAEYAVQAEVERIDATCRELWQEWEKSKQNYTKSMKKRKGIPSFGDGGGKARTTSIETQDTEVIKFGDVSYIAEIRQQQMEKRKLLGLYAPIKQEMNLKNGVAAMSREELLAELDRLESAETKTTDKGQNNKEGGNV